jgi:transcriptional regulator with XRE-family HTH domain
MTLLDRPLESIAAHPAGHIVAVVPRTRVASRQAKNFGTYLSGLMDARGLDNLELGRLAGVSDATVSRWRNNVVVPSEGALRRVAPHLGVRYGELLIHADLATPEELGTAGAPPPPGAPLPTQIRSIMADMINPRVSSRDKEILLKVIARAHQMWREMRDVPREPQMRRR